MERQRCTACRNPIRNDHYTVDPGDPESYYHNDCWESAKDNVVERPMLGSPGVDHLTMLLSAYGWKAGQTTTLASREVVVVAVEAVDAEEAGDNERPIEIVAQPISA